MNREIKFRAKALTGELVYFELHESQMSGDSDVFYVRGDPCEVGSEQAFTGLKDKNGKEGYHKDLARDSQGDLWLIAWLATDARFGLLQVKYGEATGKGLDMRYLEDMLIIGKILQNKELLNG